VIPLWSRLAVRTRPWAVALLAAATAACAVLGASFAAPAEVAGMGPLPPCSYGDVLTAPQGYEDWPITLVDTILRVTPDYVPTDLVPVSKAGLSGSGSIRSLAIADLRAMAAAARKAGSPIAVESAYRSYTTQAEIFQSWVDRVGYQQALLHTARPGHSEHQLGLAIDFKSAGSVAPSGGDWGTTPAGTWMRRHAWTYGWVQSYPKGQASKTCYMYEAWHFRYVGRDLAAKVHASGLTLREYLWAHFTTATVPGTSPLPTVSPTSSGAPSLQPGSPGGESEPPGTMDPGPTLPSAGLPAGSDPSPTALQGESPGPSSTPAVTGTTAAASLDPDTVAAIGLVAGLAALLLVIVIALRRRRRSGPGS
jgi:LAS superfamily LD-carboxypeptidase LdcB